MKLSRISEGELLARLATEVGGAIPDVLRRRTERPDVSAREVAPSVKAAADRAERTSRERARSETCKGLQRG